MSISALLAAFLDFLNRSSLIYFAVFLTALCIFSLPIELAKDLGLDPLSSGVYKGWVNGIGILSFFLWATSLWPLFQKSYTDWQKAKADIERAASSFVCFKGLPTASRSIIGYCIEHDRDSIEIALHDPGIQEIMDTGLVFYSGSRMHFLDSIWKSLKN